MAKHIVKCVAEWEYEIDLNSGAYDFAEGNIAVAIQGNAEADLIDLFTGVITFTQTVGNVKYVTEYSK